MKQGKEWSEKVGMSGETWRIPGFLVQGKSSSLDVLECKRRGKMRLVSGTRP